MLTTFTANFNIHTHPQNLPGVASAGVCFFQNNSITNF